MKNKLNLFFILCKKTAEKVKKTINIEFFSYCATKAAEKVKITINFNDEIV